MSPKVANAAPFMPKGSNPVRHETATPPVSQDHHIPEWPPPEVPEFVPHTFDSMHLGDPTTSTSINPYDPFVTSTTPLSSAGNPNQPQINPYAQESATNSNTAFYQGQSGYAQPLQYHLYAPIGPHRENLLAYQRTAHDFFISDNLREELQRKSEASLQVLPSKITTPPKLDFGKDMKSILSKETDSTLPAQIDHFHSLVPLDITNQKSAAFFEYPSWVYKVVSSKDGNTYALRRLEGYRLTNERAIRAIQAWKRVSSGNVVTIHDAFTTRAFGDSSLVFVTDYHPLSKTLVEQHLNSANRYSARPTGAHVPEQVLWSYMVQIASALKTIHGAGLAARSIDASKILVTSKNRIRLNACGVFDVLHHERSQLGMPELQLDDLTQFGRLLLLISSNNPAGLNNMPKTMELLSRHYTSHLKDCVVWLLGPTQAQSHKSLDNFISAISGHIMTVFDNTLHLDDQLNTDLSRELENARLVRLMSKLNFINERPEFEHDRQWAETGERYFLKLFRDYVFHQVDAQGNPVIDLAHVLLCLNKLDAGIDERVSLVSRDKQNLFIISYKELKRGVEAAFQDLSKSARRV
ncbi:MAG: PAB-dependent poly(A)-specific ribonuclease subunit 3 [Candelina mexicana]|nr:MAG: PAB-dependent poly(A)-specific ribonuclease subunit 3 [Candelina mexicana]